ncbi:MAG: hypothetical protein IT372_08360 [Polyangiaceae bacterium]|nr:hypothetical protein [Polyangiaceae bacterium]
MLAETPGRALTFLTAAGKSRAIRALLRLRGYSAEDHREGWSLLHRVTGFQESERESAEDAAVGKAIAELDAWDEPNFRIISATLERRHAAQRAFVFHNLTAQVGSAAVLGVKALLDRLDALESSPDREATRKEDHAALKTLARRGYTKEERARLRGLVDVACAGTPDPMDEAEVEDEDDEAEGDGADEIDGGGEADDGDGAVGSDAHTKALLELYAWHKEWSEIARAVVKRRDYLIRLGLAHRKLQKKATRAQKAAQAQKAGQSTPEAGAAAPAEEKPPKKSP